MMRRAAAALSFILLAVAIIASHAPGTAALEIITPASFLKHIDFLADPRLEGRLPGTPQCRRAARYVASELKSAGISPAGDNGTYFQDFTFDFGDEKFRTRNVLGILEGCDAELGNEAVVVMAHYDHIGRGYTGLRKKSARGKVHPGANDNASGVSGLLEIARAIALKKLKLKRTLIFIAASGEEAGLKGSGHYVDNPVFPLEKTMIVVNLDMIGGYRGIVYALNVDTSPQIGEALDAAFTNSALVLKRSSVTGPSDHVMFHCSFVPSVFFCTGTDDIYHTPADTVDRINCGDGAALVRAIFEAVRYFADAEKIESAMKQPRGCVMAYLGVVASASRGEVVVGQVVPGSPAAKAGIRMGDVLVSVDGEEISSARDVGEVISGRRAGDVIEVKVEREGKTRVFEVELDRRRPYSKPHSRRRAA